jgi:hypothetical protein
MANLPPIRGTRGSEGSLSRPHLALMIEDGAPTLVDDEVSLARYAAALANTCASIVPQWFRRLIEDRAPGLTDIDAVANGIDRAATVVVGDLQALLILDIADQQIGPLEILRRSVRFPTQVLAAAAIPAVGRDEFSAANFPDDIYNLTPASFADVDPALHEPGLMWGAAKAHVHLRRRRETPGT